LNGDADSKDRRRKWKREINDFYWGAR